MQAAECRPGNRAVVHHILVYIHAPGKPIRTSRTAPPRRWSAGRPATCRPSTRRARPSKIPAGSKLVFEVHYTPNGTEQTDRSSVGIIFAKKPPEHAVETNILANMAFQDPAGRGEPQGRR